MISQVAKSFIGTPFRHQGRTPQFGLDCAGVLVCALEGAGVAVNDCRTYEKIPPRDLLRSMVELHGLKEKFRKPQEDDVCLFWMRNKRLVIHCGIVVDDGRNMVHVEAGRCVEIVPLRIWEDQRAATYALKEVKPWRS